MSNRDYYRHKEEHKYGNSYHSQSNNANRHASTNSDPHRKQDSVKDSHETRSRHDDSSRRESDSRRESAARAYEQEPTHKHHHKLSDSKPRSSHGDYQNRRDSGSQYEKRYTGGDEDDDDDGIKGGYGHRGYSGSPPSNRHDGKSRHGETASKASYQPHDYGRSGHKQSRHY